MDDARWWAQGARCLMAARGRKLGQPSMPSTSATSTGWTMRTEWTKWTWRTVRSRGASPLPGAMPGARGTTTQGRRGAERVRSGAGAFLEKNFWRRILPHVPTSTTLKSNGIAIAPAGTVTCRATMAYRGGGEGSPAGLGRLVFSYERRSEATKVPVGLPLYGRPVAAHRSLTIWNRSARPEAACHGPGGLRREFSRPRLAAGYGGPGAPAGFVDSPARRWYNPGEERTSGRSWRAR